MTTYIYDFEVTGRGRFPWDMLRFDSCWPIGGDDVSKLEQFTEGHVSDVVTIQFRTHKASGPTHGRWSSFLWGCRIASKGRIGRDGDYQDIPLLDSER